MNRPFAALLAPFVKAPTTVALTVTPAQYSDVSTFTATVSPATLGGSTLTGTVQLAVAGKNVGSPVAINTGGVATYKYTVTSPQGSYPVTATFASTNANFASPATAASATLVVSPRMPRLPTKATPWARSAVRSTCRPP